MGYKPGSLLKAVALLSLVTVAEPASADYFSYDGELQFETSPNALCAVMSTGKFHVRIYGRSDSRGIEASLDGEQLVRATIRGTNPSVTSLTFVGEAEPKHAMRLRQVAVGAYEGELQALSTMAAIYRCDFMNARIKINKIGDNSQASLEKAVEQFQLDSRAWQAVQQGLQGKVKEAIPALERALATKQQTYAPDDPHLLVYYFYIGQIHLAEGSVPAAIPLDRKALAVCEKNYGPESACTGAMLAVLGSALADDGEYAEAETMIHRSLALIDKFFGPGSAIRGSALNALSVILIYTGRYGEADATLGEALALNKKWPPSPDNIYVGVSLHNFGVLYQLTGQYHKAGEALKQAIAIEQKAADTTPAMLLTTTVQLIRTLVIAGHYMEAEPVARKALSAAEDLLGPERQDHPTLAIAQLCVAEILRKSGRDAEAEPLYRRALANGTKYLGPDHPSVAGVALLLAKLLHATGRDQEALGLLSHANEIAHLSGSQMIAWQVAGDLMQIYASGPFANRFEAIFYGKQAVNDLQKMRGNLSSSSSETQQAFVGSADVSAIYRTLAGLLIADGRPSEAQQVLAMVKEQEFYEFTQRTAVADAPKTVVTLTSSEKQLEELDGKYVSLGKEYGALKEKFQKEGERFSAADRSRLDVLRKAMDAAQANFEARATEVANRANDPEAQKRRKMEINDYSRAFQGTLKDMGHDAVVAQYIVLDDRVAILLATPNAVVSRESKVKRQDLYAQVLGFRKALSNPNADPQPQGQALYQLLVAPIADDLRQAGAKTLMVDLDDMLRYLPFAALYDGKNYLVESMSVVMVTEAVRDKLGKTARADWSVWGLGITKAGPGYDALPYADVELNGIAGRKGILAGKVMLDTAFTEGSLRDGLDQDFPVIHIASHFQFTPGSMDDSFLLLGDGKHLTLSEIKTKLNFNSVELLTLSACETALGDDSTSHHGVEVEGLGAIAQQAGAKAVLATLWPVADASTAALMRALYQAHKVDHLDKADALRQAQLALLRGSAAVEVSNDAQRGLARMSGGAAAGGNFKADPNAPYAHPFYWAPFILMGNWL